MEVIYQTICAVSTPSKFALFIIRRWTASVRAGLKPAPTGCLMWNYFLSNRR